MSKQKEKAQLLEEKSKKIKTPRSPGNCEKRRFKFGVRGLVTAFTDSDLSLLPLCRDESRQRKAVTSPRTPNKKECRLKIFSLRTYVRVYVLLLAEEEAAPKS